ncbi:MAG: serine/threonine protein kinase [Acidobacteriota bacterium]|nr:serine/threonine protein kinase [Blastocatellia bacterium]MDW8239331.1 serine/threonine protein kinase [Acidobacteriota bacterium]
MKQGKMSHDQAEQSFQQISPSPAVSGRARYRSLVYGLHVESNLPIPGALQDWSDAAVDTWVWLSAEPPWPVEPIDSPQQVYHVTPYRDEAGEPVLVVRRYLQTDDFRFSYSDGTEFIISRDGTRIWATWPETSTLEDTAVYLLGGVFAFALNLRGVPPLHGSAVSVNGRAVAFLGPAEAGKSTLAAAMAERGFPVLTDDVVVLVDTADGLLVQPGYPRVRLWSDSVKALYGREDALPPLTPTWDKRFLDLTKNGHRFQPHPLPLAAIYVLVPRRRESTGPRIEPLRGHVGLSTLVAATYVAYDQNKAKRARQFDVLSRLLNHVPVRQITGYRDINRIPTLCQVILDDLRSRGET